MSLVASTDINIPRRSGERCPVSTPFTGPPRFAGIRAKVPGVTELPDPRRPRQCEPRSSTKPATSPPATAQTPRSESPSDAVVRVVLACVCGSDLWYYRGDTPFEPGPIGHEFIGVVEDVGADVHTLAKGDLVIAPFAFSDGTLPQLPERHHHRLHERRLLPR